MLDFWQRDEPCLTFVQVAFIGISNWALDPAKMNRGILVQRDVPDEEELIGTARYFLFTVCDVLYCTV